MEDQHYQPNGWFCTRAHVVRAITANEGLFPFCHLLQVNPREEEHFYSHMRRGCSKLSLEVNVFSRLSCWVQKSPVGQGWQVLQHPSSGSYSCKAERTTEEQLPEPLSPSVGPAPSR